MRINRFFSISPTFAALASAILFGGSTPFAKQLIGDFSPLLLAGLLYLGSGIGLMLMRLIKYRGWQHSGLLTDDWPWLLGAIIFGGTLGPILLMMGLKQASASVASLLLNLEAVFTALLAWVVFKESTERRIVLGMLLIVAGSIVLSWPSKTASIPNWWSTITIASACMCWAIDNNLTRKVSAGEPLFIAGTKGLVAGVVSTSFALGLGTTLPHWSLVSYALMVGFIGYGASLVLFVLALRGLGTARTGAYFSTAPFIGAGIAILFLNEPTSALLWIAIILMGLGVYLHLTEHHEHDHTHELLSHSHNHIHDEHHRHEHDFLWDGSEPHYHLHHHDAIKHFHPHYPDIHHRHKHHK